VECEELLAYICPQTWREEGGGSVERRSTVRWRRRGGGADERERERERKRIRTAGFRRKARLRFSRQHAPELCFLLTLFSTTVEPCSSQERTRARKRAREREQESEGTVREKSRL
jgi:hypothetical protein